MFSYGFYNSLNGDRKYDANQMSSIFDGIIEDGVYSNVGEFFAVVPGTGMGVIVKTGRAWFNHTWSLNDSHLPIDIDQADVLQTRIDAIVIEVDARIEKRENSIKIVKGVPSVNPVKPNLLNTGNVFQHALAYITVKPAAEMIMASDIEIVVGKDETPFVQCPLKTVSLEDLWEQWDEEFNIWFDNLKATMTDNVVTNLQKQIDEKVDVKDKATNDDVKNGIKDKWIDSLLLKEVVPDLANDLGSVVYSNHDLEKESNGKYIACDGRILDSSMGLKILESRYIESEDALIDGNSSDGRVMWDISDEEQPLTGNNMAYGDYFYGSHNNKLYRRHYLEPAGSPYTLYKDLEGYSYTRHYIVNGKYIYQFNDPSTGDRATNVLDLDTGKSTRATMCYLPEDDSSGEQGVGAFYKAGDYYYYVYTIYGTPVNTATYRISSDLVSATSFTPFMDDNRKITPLMGLREETGSLLGSYPIDRGPIYFYDRYYLFGYNTYNKTIVIRTSNDGINFSNYLSVSCPTSVRVHVFDKNYIYVCCSDGLVYNIDLTTKEYFTKHIYYRNKAFTLSIDGRYAVKGTSVYFSNVYYTEFDSSYSPFSLYIDLKTGDVSGAGDLPVEYSKYGSIGLLWNTVDYNFHNMYSFGSRSIVFNSAELEKGAYRFNRAGGNSAKGYFCSVVFGSPSISRALGSIDVINRQGYIFNRFKKLDDKAVSYFFNDGGSDTFGEVVIRLDKRLAPVIPGAYLKIKE